MAYEAWHSRFWFGAFLAAIWQLFASARRWAIFRVLQENGHSDLWPVLAMLRSTSFPASANMRAAAVAERVHDTIIGQPSIADGVAEPATQAV
jgi:uncharacterized membrane protein